MPYGVLPSGFAAKPLAVIKAEIEADLQSAFGAGINLEPESNFGQIVGIMSDRETDLWQLFEALYSSTTADGAADTELDNVSAITGTTREPPKLTHVILRCAGTDGTALAAGRVASINGGARFESLADATIGAVSTGYVDVEFVAQVAGPTPAYAGTVNQIETPVAGWNSVTNPADHTALGANLESDAALRLRREEELQAQGNASIEPIRAEVLDVADVLACFVFENTGDTTDGNGLPPHSIEVVADGGTDAAIRAAIFASKAGGIATHGAVTGTITDSTGIVREIDFSRPTDVNMYIVVDVTTDPEKFPADGVDQIKDALVAFGAARYTIGSDGIASALIPSVFGISGVLDVPLPKIGTAPAPATSATIVTALRERLKVDTSRITVNVS
jgi:uncharacterized phage protein gp47/JayE